MTTTTIQVPVTSDFLEDVDFDGIIPMSSDQPLPFVRWLESVAFKVNSAVLVSTDGDEFIADLLEWHDCFVEGYESSYIFVELR